MNGNIYFYITFPQNLEKTTLTDILLKYIYISIQEIPFIPFHSIHSVFRFFRSTVPIFIFPFIYYMNGMARWIEHCVRSSQRSVFDSRSSLNFFRFFFNRLGCLFTYGDHFHYLRNNYDNVG